MRRSQPQPDMRLMHAGAASTARHRLSRARAAMQVLHSDIGQTLPWYFPLQGSYWRGQPAARPAQPAEAGSKGKLHWFAHARSRQAAGASPAGS